MSTTPNEVPRGQRKFRHAFQQSILLLIAFIVTAAFKVPTELFAAFVAGLAGQSAAFVWGNVKSNQSTNTGI